MREKLKNLKKTVKGTAGGLISALVVMSKGAREIKVPPKKKIKELKRGDSVSGHEVNKVYYDDNHKAIGFSCKGCHKLGDNRIHPLFRETGKFETFRTTHLYTEKK